MKMFTSAVANASNSKTLSTRTSIGTILRERHVSNGRTQPQASSKERRPQSICQPEAAGKRGGDLQAHSQFSAKPVPQRSCEDPESGGKYLAIKYIGVHNDTVGILSRKQRLRERVPSVNATRHSKSPKPTALKCVGNRSNLSSVSPSPLPEKRTIEPRQPTAKPPDSRQRLAKREQTQLEATQRIQFNQLFQSTEAVVEREESRVSFSSSNPNVSSSYNKRRAQNRTQERLVIYNALEAVDQPLGDGFGGSQPPGGSISPHQNMIKYFQQNLDQMHNPHFRFETEPQQSPMQHKKSPIARRPPGSRYLRGSPRRLQYSQAAERDSPDVQDFFQPAAQRTATPQPQPHPHVQSELRSTTEMSEPQHYTVATVHQSQCSSQQSQPISQRKSFQQRTSFQTQLNDTQTANEFLKGRLLTEEPLPEPHKYNQFVINRYSIPHKLRCIVKKREKRIRSDALSQVFFRDALVDQYVPQRK